MIEKEYILLVVFVGFYTMIIIVTIGKLLNEKDDE